MLIWGVGTCHSKHLTCFIIKIIDKKCFHNGIFIWNFLFSIWQLLPSRHDWTGSCSIPSLGGDSGARKFLNVWMCAVAIYQHSTTMVIYINRCLFRILKHRLTTIKTADFGPDICYTHGYKCIHTNIKIHFLKIMITL